MRSRFDVVRANKWRRFSANNIVCDGIHATVIVYNGKIKSCPS